MKFIICYFTFLFLFSNSYAGTFYSKLDYSLNKTDNVNSSNSDYVKDSYSNLILNLGHKGEEYRFRLRIKSERYQMTSENNSRSVSFNTIYKSNRTTEYSFDFYQQKYTDIPLISGDISSDNHGLKIGANFTKAYSEKRVGYLGVLLNSKQYPNLENRNDRILDLSLGYEYYPNSTILILPELLFSYNQSNQDYYSNYTIGPSLFLSLNITDELELSTSFVLTHTQYTDRSFQETKGSRTVSVKEHQSLFATDIGLSYSIFNNLTISSKIGSSRNSSNNPSAPYRTESISFSVSLKTK